MSARLADVFEGYLDLRYRIDPVEGTRAGRHELDGMYAAYDAASVRAHTAALRSYTGALEEAAAGTLDEEIDRTAALHDARHALLLFDRERPFARDPAFHLGHALDGLHQLLSDNGAEPVRQAAALASRLAALPAFLATAATALTQPLRPLLTAAAAMVPGGLVLLDDGLDDALAPAVGDAEARAGLRGVARDALLGFSDALSLMEERARDDVGMGRDLFERKMQTAHMVQDGAAQLMRWAEAAYAEARTGVEAAAAEVKPDTDWRTIIARLDEELAPLPGRSVLGAYGDAVDAAGLFAAKRGIVSSTDTPVRIVPTPEYRRPLVPFVAYAGPGSFDAEQSGTLYVTMPGDAPNAAVHRGADLASAVIHEIVPGHHHQAVVANRLPQAMRRVVVSASAREGWACYAEMVMAEEGFFVSPAARLLHARNVLWRALRVILDVSLHTAAMTTAAAERRLREEIGLDEAAARADVARAIAHPTLLSCFAVGRREIVRLRDDARRVWGSGFSLARFHDELLRYGAYPTALARWGMGLA